MTRVRADALLVARKLAASRTEAQALIMAGKVTSGPRRIDKPGTLLPEDAEVHVASGPRFVSRGGDKLEHALAAFAAQHGLDVAGKTCVDVGASTGGFTDCLLQRGAARVFAVDVGYGQLASKLRADPRVEVRDRVNARELRREDFDCPIDLVVVDASFISISRLIEAIARLLRPSGDLVALIKPQFEAGREAAARGRGVIRDEATRLAAIAEARQAIEAAGFSVVGEVDSAVRGPKGNVEHFVHARRAG
ncbi:MULTISPECIES: TlyA family RNA methyltransferase [Sorangium]|uniref:Hemolysin n=1 Tax=Sorangium cellulosum TaxID=56 RepID=A0A4P2R4T6_SORCE|nr:MULTISPECIES: TlyA family RNA methyltransferase [Sorangium]AUX37768.1 hemolysin [Sorangium cellulosum]WCQ97057.1 Hemolysin A [Sorangium sp. Soce836]